VNERISPEAKVVSLKAEPVRTAAKPANPAPVQGRRLFKRWLVVALGLVVILAAALALWRQYAAQGVVHYAAVAATRGPVTRTVTATGTVNPELTIIVGTYVSGVIQQLFCDYNTRVKQGQICAKIDPRPYQSIVDQNKANLAVATAQLEKDKANLEYARLNNERNQHLLKSNAVSQDAADNANSVYQQAQAQMAFDEATIEQRRAELASAQVNLDYTNIVSPVDGTVVSRNVTIGQTVAASFQTPTLFLIASDLARMQVDTNVSESDIGGVKEGNAATFTVDAFAKRSFTGKVSQVRQSPQTVQNVVTYDVVVSVDNSDLALKPGMTAATRIIVDQHDNVLRVPNQALRFTPAGVSQGASADKAQIWVMRRGAPTAVPIIPGLDDENFTEVAEGDLQPGDRVIVGEERASNRPLPTPRF